MVEQGEFLHNCAQYISVMFGVLFSAPWIIIYVWHLSIKLSLLACCHQQEKQLQAGFTSLVFSHRYISIRIRVMQDFAI